MYGYYKIQLVTPVLRYANKFIQWKNLPEQVEFNK